VSSQLRSRPAAFAPLATIWAGFVGSLILAVLSPFSGWLSDRIGLRKVVFGSLVALVVLICPAFVLLNARYARVGQRSDAPEAVRYRSGSQLLRGYRDLRQFLAVLFDHFDHFDDRNVVSAGRNWSAFISRTAR